MLLAVLRKLLPSYSAKILKQCLSLVKVINALESEISALSDEELTGKTKYFRNLLQQGKTLDEILPHAFAVVREVSKRLLNMRHYDVQLVGGMILHKGCVAEMKTGEGKTLVATLPAYLNALAGRVHIVSVNNYLTFRDYKWMSRIYKFLEIECDYITEDKSKDEKRIAYAADITFVTNSELGFDYLRDNMELSVSELLFPKNPFNFAILDEVDSILIDEARTPLIISGMGRKSSDKYLKIDKIVRNLSKDNYELNEKHQSAQLTEIGSSNVESQLQKMGLIESGKSMYDMDYYEIVNHVLQSLKAHYILKKDHDYIVANGEVLLVDEFTGRISEGRRYSGGLHQAIEAKEGVEIHSENQLIASTTYQNFFRMYKKLSGMTGTAFTEKEEFESTYGLKVISVPTFRPVVRKDHRDFVFKTEEEKFAHIVKVVKDRNAKGQPILLGTASISKSEALSTLLQKAGVQHKVLNAKQHEKEAQIISEAGRRNSVTIATNMAGRGTDILLGGSLDAKILDVIEGVVDSDEIRAITEKIRADHEKERQEVVALGGLFVMGSERHESRRIDNQLRGRAGRLGDPGESQFFLSLQDDLLRIFGGERVDAMLTRLGFKGGEVMEHPILDSVISKSQKKLENFNHEIRRNVLKYDDIANEQRTFVYQQRQVFLTSEDLDPIVKRIISNVTRDIVDDCIWEGVINFEEVISSLREFWGDTLHSIVVDNELYTAERRQDFEDIINEQLYSIYVKKIDSIEFEEKIQIIRYVLLQTMDECWKDHLSYISHVREGIHLRAYGQKDPFTEYKMEALNAIDQMLKSFDRLSISRLIHVQVTLALPQENRKTNDNYKVENQSYYDLKQNNPLVALDDNLMTDSKSRNVSVGRNDPCPCGSGKKYKSCHGK